MSLEVYKQGGWPMTSNHHWRIRATIQSLEELSGACPNVEVSIGGVTVLQHFFIQDSATYISSYIRATLYGCCPHGDQGIG